MQPPIAPVGLDYIASAAQAAGIKVEILDLCLAEDPSAALKQYFASHQPRLIGISFRNVDDCFWPSGQWFVPKLTDLVNAIRNLTDAKIFLGGVGFSIAPGRILAQTGADFGVHGDGEQATIALYQQIQGKQDLSKVPGLLFKTDGQWRHNQPAWPEPLSVPTARSFIDNRTYFQRGGQIGLETKRGCARPCIYCADPLAKGNTFRLRNPREIADEAEQLLAQDVDCLHICDGEFNLPRSHALAVCQEFVRRRLGDRLRWYTYMSVTPFDSELAALMRKAGCVGIDFTGDAACPSMLKEYCQPHIPADLASAVDLCRENNITVMVDLLLGGPGETPKTVAESINFMKQIAPDAVGAPLGLRIYENTPAARIIRSQGPLETNPSLRRKYSGDVDFLRPTFYISSVLGEQPGRLVRDMIGDDPRFFAPEDEDVTDSDHNYNDNTPLVNAIAGGARGAFWHILLQLRTSNK